MGTLLVVGWSMQLLMECLLTPEMAPGDSDVVMGVIFGGQLLSLACLCIMFGAHRRMSQYPFNYVVMGAFTIAEAPMLGFIYTSGSRIFALFLMCLVLAMSPGFVYKCF